MAVMYVGKMVEIAPKRAILAASGHPYEQALLQSGPLASPRQRRILAGDVHSPFQSTPGCRFHAR